MNRFAVLAVVLTAIAFSGEGRAQLQSAPQSGGTGAGPLVARQGQPEALDVGGFVFQVTQLIRNDQQNSLRVIMQATDTIDPGRWVALVQPPAVMIDNMGNQWVAVSSNGIRICASKNQWDELPRFCDLNQRSGDDLLKLSPNTPQIMVLEFAPLDGGVIDKTLELATEATLTARFIAVTEPRDWVLQDITIPGIALP